MSENDRNPKNIKLLVCAKTWHSQRMLCLESGGIIYKSSINSGLPKRLVMFVCWGGGEGGQGLKMDLLTPKGLALRFQDSIKGQ